MINILAVVFAFALIIAIAFFLLKKLTKGSRVDNDNSILIEEPEEGEESDTNIEDNIAPRATNTNRANTATTASASRTVSTVRDRNYSLLTYS
jgi:hypothetical protein